MDERKPSLPPEEPEGEGLEPSVPLPEDFPENAKVVPTPSKSVEEQRRELLEKDEDTAIKKRHGGGLSDSTPIA